MLPGSAAVALAPELPDSEGSGTAPVEPTSASEDVDIVDCLLRIRLFKNKVIEH